MNKEIATAKAQEVKHTPSSKMKIRPSALPRLDWIEEQGRVGPTVYVIEEESGLVVAELPASQRGREDAAGIVLRNNAHDVLVEALRSALCPVCKYSIGFRPQATNVSPEWPNCEGCKVPRTALAAAQE